MSLRKNTIALFVLGAETIGAYLHQSLLSLQLVNIPLTMMLLAYICSHAVNARERESITTTNRHQVCHVIIGSFLNISAAESH